MVFQQNTSDNDWVFLNDKEKARYEEDEIKKLIKRKRDVDADLSYNLRKRKEATQKWSGHDDDADNLGDPIEIQAGLHDVHNVPLHKPIKRFGPTTKGNAYVGGGGIQFDYDDSIISLKVKPTHSVVGGVHRMKEPRKMPLSIDFGDKHSHVNGIGGFSINLDVHPEKFRMNTDKIKNSGIRKLKVVKKSPKDGIKAEARENREDINELSQRLSGFVKKQKKSSGVDLIGGKNLDFSHVGITTGLTKKKKGLTL